MSHSIHSSHSSRSVVKPRFDPLVQPVVSTKPLPVLAAESMQMDFIREAFERAISWQVEPVFAHSFDEKNRTVNLAEAWVDAGADADTGATSTATGTAMSTSAGATAGDATIGGATTDAGIIEAAVLIALIQRPSGLHVLFTRRAAHLYDHAGQISFPGGRIEPYDTDAIAAALRETWEEVGISSEFIDVLGTQPSFLTSTRFTMKPVIGCVRPGFSITPDLAEVAEVFEVPLSVLMDTRCHCLHEARLPDGNNRFYFSISWHSHFIWGATAALVRNLYHYLAAAQLSSS